MPLRAGSAAGRSHSRAECASRSRCGTTSCACPSTTPIDSKTPSPRCVLSSPTLSAGAAASTEREGVGEVARGRRRLRRDRSSVRSAGSCSEPRRPGIDRQRHRVTMEWPGRITPGSNFCRCERPSAERRSCGPVFSCPGPPAMRQGAASDQCVQIATASPRPRGPARSCSAAARAWSVRSLATARWARSRRPCAWRRRPARGRTTPRDRARRRSRRGTRRAGSCRSVRRARPGWPEPGLPRSTASDRGSSTRPRSYSSAAVCGSLWIASCSR